MHKLKIRYFSCGASEAASILNLLVSRWEWSSENDSTNPSIARYTSLAKYTASYPSFAVKEDFHILTQVDVHLALSLTAPLYQTEPPRLYFDKANKDCICEY